MVVINLARFIEDDGYEAIPYGHQSDWRVWDNVGNVRKGYSRPVAPGRAAPDVAVHLRIAAFLCGLGEIGFSKMFLSTRFGPRNRIGIVITDVPLEPDPIYAGPKLCDRCMACVRNCPAGALKTDKTVKVQLAGREVEWNDIDCSACDFGFRGGVPTADDVPPDQQYMDKWGKVNVKRGWWTPFFEKPRNLYNTGQAICGARGCTRACMMALEARGVLENKFHQPFRRRTPWRVDWDQPAPATDATAGGPETD
jgi:ferredoxin